MESRKLSKKREFFGNSNYGEVLLYIDHTDLESGTMYLSGRKLGYINGISDIFCSVDMKIFIKRCVGSRKIISANKDRLVSTYEKPVWSLDVLEDILLKKIDAGDKIPTIIIVSNPFGIEHVLKKSIQHGFSVELYTYMFMCKEIKNLHSFGINTFFIDYIFDEIACRRPSWINRRIKSETYLIVKINLAENQEKTQFLQSFTETAERYFAVPMMARYYDTSTMIMMPSVADSDCDNGSKVTLYDFNIHIKPYCFMLMEHFKSCCVSVDCLENFSTSIYNDE